MHRTGVAVLVGGWLGAIVALVAVAEIRAPAIASGPVAGISATVEPGEPVAADGPSTSAQRRLPDAATLGALVPGSLSALVYDRTTGRTVVSVRPEASYTSASVVKLLIALEALRRNQPVGPVRDMLSRSDDHIASLLWSRLGGPAIVTGWADRIGLVATRPPADPGHWGATVVTASDLLRLYHYLLQRAPDPTRRIILDALHGATRLGADGFDQYFGIPSAVTGTDWAVKQGWSCCDPDRNLHTTGVVDHGRYVVIVLTSQPRGRDWASAARAVTDVLRAVAVPLGWT